MQFRLALSISSFNECLGKVERYAAVRNTVHLFPGKH